MKTSLLLASLLLLSACDNTPKETPKKAEPPKGGPIGIRIAPGDSSPIEVSEGSFVFHKRGGAAIDDTGFYAEVNEQGFIPHGIYLRGCASPTDTTCAINLSSGWVADVFDSVPAVINELSGIGASPNNSVLSSNKTNYPFLADNSGVTHETDTAWDHLMINTGDGHMTSFTCSTHPCKAIILYCGIGNTYTNPMRCRP